MPNDLLALLNEPIVRAGLQQAWEDSEPGPSGGHEEGGFIVRDSTGNLTIVRWPHGTRNSIVVPPHPNCQIDTQEIVATFHTHPNTGPDFLQEPSETDKRAVRDDPDLKHDHYEGEFVVSAQVVYHINPDGQVDEITETEKYFAED